jgi:hypothetical protein
MFGAIPPSQYTFIAWCSDKAQISCFVLRMSRVLCSVVKSATPTESACSSSAPQDSLELFLPYPSQFTTRSYKECCHSGKELIELH